MGISLLPRKRGFEERNCSLCGSLIFYGQDIKTGNKVAFDREEVHNHVVGEIALVDPDLVDDNPRVIKFVPENERWMHATLFTAHRNTCIGWAECQSLGLSFEQCKQRINADRGKKPFTTASIRDKMAGRNSGT